MSEATFMIGDVFERIADIPDDSIDLVMTSPPFLALRSYLPDGHPDKHREIGSEPDPAGFVDTMLHLVAELDRVVKPTGSIAIELGDTYSGSGGSGGDYNDGGLRSGQAKFSGSAAKRRANGEGDNPRPARTGRNGNTIGHASKDRYASSDNRAGWPLAKSMTLIPELVRVGLAYGINPLTGEPSPAGRWRVRNVVRWYRPNPTVGALGDKYRPATSDMVIACRSKTRWFDLDAVRHEPEHGYTSTRSERHDNRLVPGQPKRKTNPLNGDGQRIETNPAGAPPHDMWNISTSPYKGSHYATYPLELCRIPILSMCPHQVCSACGEPRRRIVESSRKLEGTGPTDRLQEQVDNGDRHPGYWEPNNGKTLTLRKTTGWTDCGCNAGWQPGVVLDPFAGSGTTLQAAIGHGRSAIGIDIDERNAWLARERVGMFLTIDNGPTQAAS
ncbi:MAG: DNA methyltransferase [Actinomycetota bacterium]